MRVTWHPRNLLIGVLLVVVFALALNTAVGVRTGAIVGTAALLVYLLVDVLLTVNPARWGERRRHT